MAKTEFEFDAELSQPQTWTPSAGIILARCPDPDETGRHNIVVSDVQDGKSVGKVKCSRIKTLNTEECSFEAELVFKGFQE